MTEVRGPGFITATVRFGKHGTFAYFRGQTKVETRARVRARVWYHSIVTIHLASRTYDWRLTTTTGRVILAVRNVPWRQRGPAIPVVDSTCLRTPVGGPGIGIDWNDYIVRR